MNLYLDSSALVKLYIYEVGSDKIREIVLAEENTIFISAITGAEAVAAFARRKRMKDITDEDYSELLSDFLLDFENLFVKSKVTDLVVSLAMELANRRALRGYDAVQLASALVLNSEIVNGIVFVSADIELNDTAKAENLVVDEISKN